MLKRAMLHYAFGLFISMMSLAMAGKGGVGTGGSSSAYRSSTSYGGGYSSGSYGRSYGSSYNNYNSYNSYNSYGRRRYGASSSANHRSGNGGSDNEVIVWCIVCVSAIAIVILYCYCQRRQTNRSNAYQNGNTTNYINSSLRVEKENYSPPPTAKEWLKRDETVNINIDVPPPYNPNYTPSEHEVEIEGEEGAIPTGSIPTPHYSIFIDGEYDGYYEQYNETHDIPRFKMEFRNGHVFGDGYDEVGSYKIVGEYNENNNRMALTQSYIRGTGNPDQNSGHNVLIRLSWNVMTKRFEGKWYCKVDTYQGSGMWCISKA